MTERTPLDVIGGSLGSGKTTLLKRLLAGEPIDPERQHLNADVKAITMHRFRLQETAGRWKAEVVFDIWSSVRHHA